MLATAEVWPIVWRTLSISGVAVLLAALIGVPFGAWLALANIPGRRCLVVLVYTGMGVPPVVVGLGVYLLLSRAGALGSLGLLFTPTAMTFAQTLIALPIVAGLTHAAIAAVPTGLTLQLRSLGASPWQVRLAVMRQARAGILVAIAAAFGRAISEVGAAHMVGGNVQGQTRVLSTTIALETGKGEFALALALAGWLLGLAMLVNLVLLSAHGRPHP